MKTRTHHIHMTNEARVLKCLRLERGLSMRQAGELLGKSDSYISQIENGRLKPPRGEALELLLSLYGGPKVESFFARVRLHQEKFTEKEEIVELLQKTNELETSLLLKFMKALVA
jgi:transcriptional regulator with XRE-family HTH domain